MIQLASHYILVHRPANVLATLARLTSDPKRFPDGRLEAGDFFVRLAITRPLCASSRRAYNNIRVKVRKLRASIARGSRRCWQPKARAIRLRPWSPICSGKIRKIPKHELYARRYRWRQAKRARLRAALSELQELAKAMPSNATLHFNLGSAYMAATDQQNLGSAREQLEIALTNRPSSRAGQTGLGAAGIDAGRTGSGSSGRGRGFARRSGQSGGAPDSRQRPPQNGAAGEGARRADRSA